MGGHFGKHLTPLLEKVSVWRGLSLLPGNRRPEAVPWFFGRPPCHKPDVGLSLPQGEPLASSRLPLIAERWLPGSYKRVLCRASSQQGHGARGWHRKT